MWQSLLSNDKAACSLPKSAPSPTLFASKHSLFFSSRLPLQVDAPRMDRTNTRTHSFFPHPHISWDSLLGMLLSPIPAAALQRCLRCRNCLDAECKELRASNSKLLSEKKKTFERSIELLLSSPPSFLRSSIFASCGKWDLITSTRWHHSFQVSTHTIVLAVLQSFSLRYFPIILLRLSPQNI